MSSDQQNTSHIKFVCTSCNAAFKLSAKYAGRKCKCKCGATQRIPLTSSNSVMPPSLPSSDANPDTKLVANQPQNVTEECSALYKFVKGIGLLLGGVGTFVGLFGVFAVVRGVGTIMSSSSKDHVAFHRAYISIGIGLVAVVVFLIIGFICYLIDQKSAENS